MFFALTALAFLLMGDINSIVTEKGEMADLIRSYDWSKSPVGTPDKWPQSLKTALSICLGSKFPMFVWWGKELTVFYNDAYIPFTGLKHPTYLGRTAREQWAEIWEALEPLTNQVMKTGEATWAQNMQLFMTRKGFLEETYFTFSYSPIKDESGQVAGIINPCQEGTGDVVSQRRLSLLRELGLFEVNTFNQLVDSVFKVLQSDLNDIPFALMYVIDKENHIPKLVDEFGIKSDVDLWPQIFEASKTGTPQVIKNLRKTCFESLSEEPYPEKPDAAYVVPMGLPNQEKEGFLVFGISSRLDFDDRYQAFLNLIAERINTYLGSLRVLELEKKRVEDLAEVDRAKTAFFSNVSHEFRTPLTLMLGPMEDMLAEKRGPLQPEVKDNIEVMHRNSLRLLKLVNSLLDFSRLEANRMQAQYEETDLGSLTRDLASSFRSTVESAGLKFSVVTEALPDKAYVDREMWEKIVLNLISNAFKYTLKGEIKIHLKAEQRNAQLIVKDSGIGIPKSELGKVFERFHRVSGAAGRNHEGTGIGLALVKELVKQHGGSVSVESEEGVGSTFVVTLPLGTKHLDLKQIVKRNNEQKKDYRARAESYLSDIVTTNELSPVTDSLAVKEKTILLADDNQDMRSYITKLLSDRYTVIAVDNGKAALEVLQKTTPDLVLSDIMMPQMDGIELLQNLRNHPVHKTLPIIFLSARAGDEAKTHGITLGADDYLTKPFSANELLARVQTQLQMTEVRKKAIVQETLVKELEGLIEARDEFISVAAHELRTPLGLLKLQTQVTERQMRKIYGSDPKSVIFQQAYELCMRQIDSLVRLVDELLDVSRIQLHRMELNYAYFDLAEVVENVLLGFKTQLSEVHIPLVTHLEKGFVGHWDEVRLRQVITNLVANVVRYAPGKPMTVSVQGVANNRVRLTVADQGHGVAPEKRNLIFKRFERGVSSRHMGGLGLGLFIAKSIVEAHHGTIELDTSVSQGAQFVVELPQNTALN